MRKVVIFTLLAVFGTMTLTGQDVNPKKAYRDAKKNLSSFELDNAKLDELNEAVDLIMIASKDGELKSDPEVWITMGNIFGAYLDYDYKKSLMDENYKPQYLQQANKAYMAYKKAFEVAEKDRNKEDALAGMAGLIQSMSNSGITVLQANDPMGAYGIFRNVLDIHQLLIDNGMDSPLKDEEAMNNQLFLTGYAALLGDQYELAKPYYEKLKEKNYDDPSLYEGLYKIKAQTDTAGAVAILAEGRQKYPNDLTLLYAEINNALKNNEIGSLESKLKEAIQKDPENVSLYTTTGSVYDRLFQEELDSNYVQAMAYFDSAKVYFQKALEINPDNVDAIYSIGALYYNLAAQGTQELQSLADDLTTAGMKKYDTKKQEVDKVFEDALPYFQKAERINPSDRNTLIALKEIYARQNKMDISKIFAERLEKVEAGESVDSSYFEQN